LHLESFRLARDAHPVVSVSSTENEAMITNGVGDVVGPDDVTVLSDIGRKSRGSAWEVNRDELASSKQKTVVSSAIGVTRLCGAIVAHNVVVRVDSTLTRIRVSNAPGKSIVMNWPCRLSRKTCPAIGVTNVASDDLPARIAFLTVRLVATRKVNRRVLSSSE
jgi:hypothetical protein